MRNEFFLRWVTANDPCKKLINQNMFLSILKYLCMYVKYVLKCKGYKDFGFVRNIYYFMHCLLTKPRHCLKNIRKALPYTCLKLTKLSNHERYIG